MKFFRFSALAGLCGASAIASASFDLMLLPGADGRMYRHDPVNQISLGSYNSSSTNTISTIYTGGTALSASSTGSAIREYNYSTGNLNTIRNLVTGGRALDTFGTNILMLTSTSARMFNSSNTLIASKLLDNTISWQTGVRAGNYFHLIGTSASNFLTFQSWNLVTGVLGAATVTTTQLGTGLIGAAAEATNTGTTAREIAFVSSVTGTSFNLISQELTSDGSFVNNPTSITIPTSFSMTRMMPAVVRGHSGVYVVGDDVSGSATTRIMRQDFNGSFLFNHSYTIAAPGGALSYSAGFFQPSIVVAPEPATMAAIGVAVASLLRRRKK